MHVTTISTKFQIVIPKEVRERLNLQPGQKLQAIPYRGRIELIPVEAVGATRGMAPGISTRVDREADREADRERDRDTDREADQQVDGE